MTKPNHEQVEAYNARRRAKYAEEQAKLADMPKWIPPTPLDNTKRGRKRADEIKRRMLTDFLNAKTPHDKREVIKSFNPYYFQFGNKLDPRNPYERNDIESN